MNKRIPNMSVLVKTLVILVHVLFIIYIVGAMYPAWDESNEITRNEQMFLRWFGTPALIVTVLTAILYVINLMRKGCNRQSNKFDCE